MIKFIVLSLLIVTSAHAGDAPEMTVQSAEQAVTCFQKAREELKSSLSERQRDTLTSACQMSGLRIRLLHPVEFQTLHPAYFETYLKDPWPGRTFHCCALLVRSPPLPAARIRHGIWITASSITVSLWVYLDAVTGKLLYVCVVPEG